VSVDVLLARRAWLLEPDAADSRKATFLEGFFATNPMVLAVLGVAGSACIEFGPRGPLVRS
jgi:hypothetical protein